MTDTDIKQTLDALIARKANSPEFTLELEGYRDDLENDGLDGADEKYIRDLAKRLNEAPSPAPDESDDEDEAGGDAAEDTSDTRFERAKAAFHDRFHPDNIDPDADDAPVRRALYEEYQAELERIENEG